MLEGLRRVFAVYTGDVAVLREELAKLDPEYRFLRDGAEVIRMREYARGKGIGPADHAYPDRAYVRGEPPTPDPRET